jgi:arginine/lysine/ornithine decarboxylase
MRPIGDMLHKYQSDETIRMHVPSHKGRLTIDAKGDITETSLSDNLHMPQGVIKESQQLYAQSVGANRTFFLVNGATVGVMAMLLPFKRVILSRQCHKSAINAAYIGGIELEFIWHEGVISVDDVKEAMKRLAHAPVLITYPDYYGRCCDIQGIAKAVHAEGRLLLIDQSHGAHFAFDKRLPASAGQYADIWVDSLHKTGLALTQAACLHTAKCAAHYIPSIERSLSCLQSSSPSYLLMASIEKSMHMLSDKSLWDEGFKRLAAFKQKLHGITGIELVNTDDPFRIVLDVSQRTTGIQAKKYIAQHNMQLELADLKNIVLVASMMDSEDDFNRAYCIIRDIPCSDVHKQVPSLPPRPCRRMGIRDAMIRPFRHEMLVNCIGKVSGGAMGIYPPGNCVIIPGEVFGKDTVDYLIDMQAQGLDIFGESYTLL